MAGDFHQKEVDKHEQKRDVAKLIKDCLVESKYSHYKSELSNKKTSLFYSLFLDFRGKIFVDIFSHSKTAETQFCNCFVDFAISEIPKHRSIRVLVAVSVEDLYQSHN